MFEATTLPIIGLDIAKNVFQVHQVDSGRFFQREGADGIDRGRAIPLS